MYVAYTVDNNLKTHAKLLEYWTYIPLLSLWNLFRVRIFIH